MRTQRRPGECVSDAGSMLDVQAYILCKPIPGDMFVLASAHHRASAKAPRATCPTTRASSHLRYTHNTAFQVLVAVVYSHIQPHGFLFGHRMNRTNHLSRVSAPKRGTHQPLLMMVIFVVLSHSNLTATHTTAAKDPGESSNCTEFVSTYRRTRMIWGPNASISTVERRAYA